MRRFIAKDENSVVVFGLVPDKSLTKLVPIVDQLERRLNAVRKADPGYGIAVTGLSVIAARNSAGMIEQAEPGSDASNSPSSPLSSGLRSDRRASASPVCRRESSPSSPGARS